MGEMADLFLSSQDDIDFYEECAMQGYKVPDYAMRMPTLESGSSVYEVPLGASSTSYRQRTCPAGCWVVEQPNLFLGKESVTHQAELFIV